MLRKFDPRPWRGLLVVAALGLLGLLLFSDVLAVLEQRSAIDDLQRRIAVAQSAPVKREANAMPQPPTSPRFAAADANLAAAVMQQRLSTLAEQAGARIISLAAVEKTEGNMVSLEVEADTDQPGLLRLVHGVETAVPFFFITRLSVLPQRESNRFGVVLRVEAAAESRAP